MQAQRDKPQQVAKTQILRHAVYNATGAYWKVGLLPNKGVQTSYSNAPRPFHAKKNSKQRGKGKKQKKHWIAADVALA